MTAQKTKQRVFAKDFKIQVVGEYLAGEVGATTIGRKYGVDDAVITRWISAKYCICHLVATTNGSNEARQRLSGVD
ncbi:MAG: hypothetical protein KGZ50_09295 [Peptococcaceae bacterium]|nr:hypothetical protein [Peptococcaceae bacterium]